MRFTIIDGLPYMVSHGVLYPVEIINGTEVRYDESQAQETDLEGYYTLPEIIAKCPILKSIVPKKKRTSKKSEE